MTNSSCAVPGLLMWRSSRISFSVNDLGASMSITVLMWFRRKLACTPQVPPSLATCLGPRQNYYHVLGSPTKLIPLVGVAMLKKNPAKLIPLFGVALSNNKNPLRLIPCDDRDYSCYKNLSFIKIQFLIKLE